MLFRQSPVFRLLIPFAGGIVLALFVPFPVIYIIALTLMLLLGMLLLYTSKRLSSSYKYRWLHGSAFFGIFLFTGYSFAFLNKSSNYPYHFLKEQPEHFIAMVGESPVIAQKTVKAVVEVKAIKKENKWKSAEGKMLVYFEKEGMNPLEYGDYFVFQSKLKQVKPPQNPEEFNYARYLSFHNIFHQAYLKNGSWKKLNYNGGNYLFRVSYALRNYLVEILRTTIKEKDIYSVGSALLVGYEDELDAQLVSAYSSSGALHVLSVSGMHVAIVYSILQYLLKFLLKLKGGRHFYFAATLSVLWFYAFLTGLSPSVMRAVVMLSFVVAGKWMNRNSGVLNTLAVSCFLLLIYNPFYITEVGFQLSFLAVFGIVYLHPMLFRHYVAPNKILYFIWSIVSVSICAQLITFPLGLHYFHQFPNYFLVSNLLIIPITNLVIQCGMALVVCYKVPAIGLLLAKICYACIWLANEIVLLVDKLPYAVINGISITIFETWLIYIMIATGLLYLIQKKGSQLISFLAVAVLFSLLQVNENIIIASQRKIAVFAVKGHTALHFINGKQSYFYTDSALQQNKDKQRFHLWQYWWRHGIYNPVFVNHDKTTDCFIKQKNYFYFAGNTIVLIDSIAALRLNGFYKGEKLKTELLILSRNAKISLKKLQYYFSFRQLIIDSSNSFYKTKYWIEEAKKLNIKYHAVQEDGAFIMDLKHQTK